MLKTHSHPSLRVLSSNYSNSQRSLTSKQIEETDFYRDCLDNFYHFLQNNKIKRTLKRLSQIIQNQILD